MSMCAVKRPSHLGADDQRSHGVHCAFFPGAGHWNSGNQFGDRRHGRNHSAECGHGGEISASTVMLSSEAERLAQLVSGFRLSTAFGAPGPSARVAGSESPSAHRLKAAGKGR